MDMNNLSRTAVMPPQQSPYQQLMPVGAQPPQMMDQRGTMPPQGTQETPVGGYAPQPMPGQMPPGLMGNWGGGRPQMPTPAMMGGWGRPAMPTPQQPTTGNWQQQLAGLQQQLSGQKNPMSQLAGGYNQAQLQGPSSLPPQFGGYMGQGRPAGGTPWAAPQGPQQPNGGMPMLQPDPSMSGNIGQPVPSNMDSFGVPQRPMGTEQMQPQIGSKPGWNGPGAEVMGGPSVGPWAGQQPNPQFGSRLGGGMGNMSGGMGMGQYTPPQNMGGQGKGGQGGGGYGGQGGQGKGGQTQQRRGKGG